MGKGSEVWRRTETEPSRLDEITPTGITARLGTMTYWTGANICKLSGTCNTAVCVCVCVEMKQESSAVKCVEVCRLFSGTVRVSIHQGEDGDVQRVPNFSHHQPAIHIWHAFTLIHTKYAS